MRILIVMTATVVEGMLLTLPGYCSDWWPVRAQVTSIAVGVALLAWAVSLLAWLLKGKDAWKV